MNAILSHERDMIVTIRVIDIFVCFIKPSFWDANGIKFDI